MSPKTIMVTDGTNVEQITISDETANIAAGTIGRIIEHNYQPDAFPTPDQKIAEELRRLKNTLNLENSDQKRRLP